jgi:uncharacterized protein (TIGR03545 family)
MRRKFILFVLVPVVGLLLLTYFFIDTWITAGLEYAGTKAVGAKVEIDGLHLTLSPIAAEFRRLQVTDPSDGWKNLFESGRVKFSLNFGQLLRSKFIIETMEVNDVVLGTKRSTDGSIAKPKSTATAVAATGDTSASGVPGAAAAAASTQAKKAPIFDVAEIRKTLNIDSLVNPNNLASVRLIDSLKRQLQTASVDWQKTVDGFDASKPRLAEIEASVKSINVKEIKSLDAAKNALAKLKDASDGANQVVGTFRDRKSALTKSVDGFTASLRSVDDLAKQDYENTVKLARLPDVSMKGLAEIILGKDVVGRAYQYLGYAEFVHQKVPALSSKPPLETPRRMEGQNIHFPEERAYPKFWIKKVLLSGGTDKKQDPEFFYARGEILNVTNDQHATGHPITAAISATRGNVTSLSVAASIDRRAEVAVDDYKVQLAGLAVGTMALGRSDFLPAKATGANADAAITVHLPGKQLESNAAIAFRNMKVSFEREPKNTVERIVRDVLASLSSFHVNLRAWKNEEKFDVAFTTDLDDQLASRTKKVLGDEVAKIQNDIRARVNAVVGSKRQELEKLFGQRRDDVLGKTKAAESQVNEKVSVVDAKKREVQAKLDAEQKKQTDDLKKKAGDALKKVFK